MKKLLALLICAALILCGYLYFVSMTSKNITPASTSSMKAEKKNGGKLTTEKNAIRQQKLLNKTGKDLTIKKNPNIPQRTSPRDVHPSGQF